MRKKWMVLPLLAASIWMPSTQSAAAEEFPNRPITLVAPFVPGGPADIVARQLASKVTAIYKTPVIVLNKPGASATIGTAAVFRAKPDGYTVLLADNISTVFQPLILDLPYTGPRDFDPIIKVLDITNALVVRTDAKWKTLGDLISDAKAHPGRLRISTAGRYTGTDLNVLELNHLASVDMMTIPTKGTGASIALLLGGQVDGVVGGVGAVMNQVRAGTFRTVAVFRRERDPALPDTPTTGELGYKTTMYPMFFISAPKNLDKGIAEKLAGMFRSAVNSAEFEQFAVRSGFHVDPKGSEALGQELSDWEVFFKNLVKTLRLRP